MALPPDQEGMAPTVKMLENARRRMPGAPRDSLAPQPTLSSASAIPGSSLFRTGTTIV